MLFRLVLFITFLLNLIYVCNGENVKKNVEEDIDVTDDNGKEESLDIPIEPQPEPHNNTCTRRQNGNQMHEIRLANAKQFPFIAAIMSQQNDYICAGTIVSNGLILTTAQCIQQAIHYVLVNTTIAKKVDPAVALHIIKTEKFPTYNGNADDTNVGIIYTEKINGSFASKIKLSNSTSFDIIIFEALGFGLNVNVGEKRELQYVGVEGRSSDKRGGYIDCIDTKVLTCFKDAGGPIIFDNELYGIITKGEDTCLVMMTSTYTVHKHLVDILPTFTFKAWLDEKIKKNEEQDIAPLVVYPSTPVLREGVHIMTGKNTGVTNILSKFACVFGTLLIVT